MTHTTPSEAEILAIERPQPSLLAYYVISSLRFGPGFFVALIVLYFRYQSMRYRIDQEGLSMSWGVLFRREIHLTYARIQDIHLNSNLIERWLGLARIEIQTASGSSKAEMTIEGVAAYDALRDYLYGKMRGARHLDRAAPPRPAAALQDGVALPDAAHSSDDELVAVLRSVASELQALRLAIERRSSQTGVSDA
ncbi:MAG: PH domain-containing protein [Bryobacterales bacterium]